MDNQERIRLMTEQSAMNPSSDVTITNLACGALYPDGRLEHEVQVRSISGNEEDILSSDKIPPYLRFGQVITACTVRIGTETDSRELAKIIRELTVTDRTIILFQIRRASLGNAYAFEAECSNPNCVDEHQRRTKEIYSIDLSELETHPPDDPTIRSKDVKLASGTVVKVAPLTGEGEARIARFDVDQASLNVLGVLSAIDGKRVEIKPTAKIGDIQPLLAWAKSLSLSDRNLIRDAARSMGGEVETEVEAKCTACGRELTLEMDLQQSFFFPSATRKRSKKKSST